MMDGQNNMVDEKVSQQLAKDIGLDNTRKFMDSLESEYQKRINSIRVGIEIKSLTALTAQAHALKSTAHVSGAYQLAEQLIKLETACNEQNVEAISIARETLTLAELTSVAYREIKF